MTEGIIIWSPGVTLESIEKQVIQKAFVHFKQNKTATASALGISIRTLDNKFEKYEAESKEAREGDERRRREKDTFLARARGNAPAQYDTSNGKASLLGNGVEPTPIASAKPALSVSERKEVQSMPPQQIAAGGARKNR